MKNIKKIITSKKAKIIAWIILVIYGVSIFFFPEMFPFKTTDYIALLILLGFLFILFSNDKKE